MEGFPYFSLMILFRDYVCLHILDKLKDNIIGGPGLTVEIDESMFGNGGAVIQINITNEFICP